MIVNEAKLSLVDPSYDFEFGQARRFQNDFLKWLHESDNQVCVVKAPTGAGKTAVFSEMCKKRGQVLLIYPTNALLNQQKKILDEEFGIESKILKGDVLNEKGYKRVREVLQFSEEFTGKVVLTNPDILQSLIQNNYYDRTGEAMEFFNRFDGIVYDEFHFYDDFEASGLLLQIKIMADRVPEIKLVFSSATPKENRALVESVDSVISSEVEFIESEYDEKGDKFRYDTEVVRESDSLWESREKIKEMLKKKINEFRGVQEPRIALIFNSAFRSNEFFNYLISDNDFEGFVEKDNGYDTSQEYHTNPEDNLILITTRKGEVGLDYDIRLLFMENPKSASSFIQRFGRAGRKNEAEVRIYNMGKVSWWKEELSYSGFVKNIYSSLNSYQTEIEKLKNFTGLRAAHAVQMREIGDQIGWYSEMNADFGGIPYFGKWKRFLDNVKNALESKSDGKFYENNLSTDTKNILEFIIECNEVLKGLRGRSLNSKIEYPRGDQDAVTSYDLLNVFQSYRIDKVFEDRISVEPKDPNDRTQIRATFPGFENEYKPYSGPLDVIEDDLQKWIDRKISRANIDKETNISKKLILKYFNLIRITQAALPHKVSYGVYTFEIDRSGSIPQVEIKTD